MPDQNLSMASTIRCDNDHCDNRYWPASPIFADGLRAAVASGWFVAWGLRSDGPVFVCCPACKEA